MGAADLGPWDPLSPDELPATLHAVSTPWWLAGGWALDSFLGRITRQHEDTDVLILRPDHVEVRRALFGWDAHAADPPGTLRPWPVGKELPEAVHDIWLRRDETQPWSFQLMIDNVKEGNWVFRRDHRITRPLKSLTGPTSTPTRPVLAPEIQLLYKSKTPRPKDQLDFEAVLPALKEEQRRWLGWALSIVTPQHPWLTRL